jgi:hypothetical protein
MKNKQNMYTTLSQQSQNMYTTLSQQSQNQISKSEKEAKSISVTHKYIIRKPWIDIDKEVYMDCWNITFTSRPL